MLRLSVAFALLALAAAPARALELRGPAPTAAASAATADAALAALARRVEALEAEVTSLRARGRPGALAGALGGRDIFVPWATCHEPGPAYVVHAEQSEAGPGGYSD